MDSINEPGGGFKPVVQFDVFAGTPLKFAEIIEEFERGCKALGEPSPLNLSNGWFTVTPEMAEDFLRRNRPGANRKAAFATVRYYARQMKNSDWPRTGQPLIFNGAGVLLDGQQRLWACYLIGASFETYIVADTPDNRYAFAYMDNCRPRTPSAALHTAGFDGVSSLINAVIQIRACVNGGLYSIQRAYRPERLSPVEVLHVAESDPKLKEGTRLAAGEYREAINIVGQKDVVAYLSYRILVGGYGEITLDDWWRDVEAAKGELAEGNAAAELRKCLEAANAKPKPMPKHLVLAHCIKAFNAWAAGETVKKLSIRVTDEFPVFVDHSAGETETEAAV